MTCHFNMTIRGIKAEKIIKASVRAGQFPALIEV